MVEVQVEKKDGHWRVKCSREDASGELRLSEVVVIPFTDEIAISPEHLISAKDATHEQIDKAYLSGKIVRQK